MHTHIFVPNGYTVHGSTVTCPTCGFHIKIETPKPNPWKCPNCSVEYHKARHIYHVVVKHNKSRIILTLPKEQEELELNCQKGRVIFCGKDVSHPIDVTEHVEYLESSKIAAVLQTDRCRQVLYDAFQQIWREIRLPWFSHNELTIERMFLLCRFIGYPSPSFFSDIPFLLEAPLKLPKEFKRIGYRMHRAKDLHKIIHQMPWCCKSIKRLVYKTPALLFYGNELDQIFHALDCNIDYFFSILSSVPKNYLFEHLSFLQTSPHCIAFVADYIHEVSVKRFQKLLHYPELLRDYATTYTCFSHRMREQARKSFHKRICCGDLELPYSLPAKLPSVPDSVITTRHGTYSFITLKSTGEFKKTGTELHNCLAYGIPFRLDNGAPIISIRYGPITSSTKAVGVLELIDNSMVLEVEGAGGKPLNKDVQEAFYLWMQQHDLEEVSSYSRPCDEDDSYFCF